jgi:hypothetical protein
MFKRLACLAFGSEAGKGRILYAVSNFLLSLLNNHNI